MADTAQYLDQDSTGKLWLVDRDAQGNETRTPVSAAQALSYVNDLIKQWGSDHIPKHGSATETIPESLVQEWLVSLAQRVQLETGKTDRLYPEIRAAIRDPDAIRLFTRDPRIAPVANDIWPNLAEIISRKLGDGDAGSGDGGANNDKVIEGPTKGDTPLPNSNAPAGTDGQPATAPPLVSAQVGDSARSADPVLAFSGQLLVEATDLEIQGIGLDFRFERTYLHATYYDGPLGRHWDHSYNLWLREAVELTSDLRYEHVVYRSTGKLSAERFVAERFDTDPGSPSVIADAVFGSPDGGHDRLFKTAGQFELVTPDGLRIGYNNDLHAEFLRDANGNEIRLFYSGTPIRLARIIDTCGRTLDLSYDVDGRLVRLHDQSIDRSIFYRYDFSGRLERVYRTLDNIKPPALVSAYRYWDDGAPPGLEDNILALIDGRGTEVLQIDYGTEPGLITYNRVVQQRDGGITRMDYSFIFEPDPDYPDEPLDTAVLRAEMIGPTGAHQTLDYNRMGRLVRSALHEEGPAGLRTIESRWRYNADLRVVSELRPDGSETVYEYGREVFARIGDPVAATPAERKSFGTLRRVVERRRPGSGGPPLRITEYEYDPRFNLISEQRGPYYANELQNRIDQGPSWTLRLSYDDRGNLVAIRHPDCVRSDGITQTGLLTTLDVDARGRLTRRAIVLEDGTTLATTYDYPPDTDQSAAIPSRETTDADGLALIRLITADAAGRTTRVEEAAGLVVDRRFDHAGRLRRAEESAGAGSPSVMTVEWAPHDRPARQTRNRVSAAGVNEAAAEMTEEFRFDPEGNVCQSTVRSADGTVDRTVTLDRGPDHLIRVSREDDVETRFTYNARGLPQTREVVAPGVPPMRWRMAYDLVGRLVSTTDSANLLEEIEYDGFGRVRTVKGPSGTRVQQDWDAGDRPTRRELWGRHPDVPGYVRLSTERFVYDACGRLLREEQAIFDPAAPPAADVWARRDFTYDRADRLVRIDGPGALTQTLAYDGLGRVIRAEGTRITTTTVFDDIARTARHEVALRGDDSLGSTVTATLVSVQRMDARGRSIEETDGLGNTFRREYDSHDQQTATVDASGVRHEMVFAPDGRVTGVTLAAGTPTSFSWTYGFDTHRRAVSATGPRGEVMRVTRDGLGRPRRIEAASRALDLSYDDAGRLHQSVESSGLVTRLEYGPDGRVARRVFDATGTPATSTRSGLGQSSIRFEYDGHGNMTRADDGVTPVDRRYDSRGLLMREQTGTSPVAWQYDETGRAVRFTFPSGRQLAFERSVEGGLERLVDLGTAPAPGPGIEILRTWPWGLGALREQRWRATTMRTERRDGAGRLVRVDEHRTVDGATVFDLRQVSDERGLPVARQMVIGPYDESAVYNVDQQARLTDESVGAGPLDVTGLDATMAVVTQASHRAEIMRVRATLPAVPDDDTHVVLALDGSRASALVVSRGAPQSATTYASTIAGRVTPQGVARADDSDSLPSSINGRPFKYDLFRQIAQAGGAAAPEAVVTRDALGRPRRLVAPGTDVEITFDGALPVAVRDAGGTTEFVRLPGSGQIVEVSDGNPLRVLSDPDRTACGLVDQSGAVVARSVRDPFGRVRDRSGTWPPLVETFHQMWALGDSGLFVAPARTYDPATGTFLEPDPLMIADGLNQYNFARGNPLAFTDLTGLMATPGGGAAGRQKGDGFRFGAGTYLAAEWWDQALVHFANAVAGSISSLFHMVQEPAKQVYDLGGGTIDAIGRASGLYDYEHKWASGIGQMGNVGVGGVFKSMGQGIIQTPGRILAAAERGDYYGFGAEMMNGYMLGRSAVGMAKSSASFVFNRGVGALGRLGQAGQVWRRSIREWQIERMESAANKVLANNGYSGPPVEYQYGGESSHMGAVSGGNRIPMIYERAFTPGFREIFLAPSQVGGIEGLTATSRLRFSLNNSLKGNLALRTMVHEGWHVRQMSMISREAWGRYTSMPSDFRNPLEWTQPGSTAQGAWNFEMATPAGSLPRAAAAFEWSLEAATENK